MRNQRFRWSRWARQDSNLRPLGEQQPGYVGYKTPIYLAILGYLGVVHRGGGTSKTDDKVTVDHGRRSSRRHRLGQWLTTITDAVLVAASFLPIFVAVLVVGREDRKTGGER